MESRKSALYADCGLGRVQTHGEIVQNDIDDVVPDLAGIVGVVSQGLIIGDEDIDLIELA